VARRKHDSDEMLGLDSLMDTMTNVVGILVVILEVLLLELLGFVGRL